VDVPEFWLCDDCVMMDQVQQQQALDFNKSKQSRENVEPHDSRSWETLIFRQLYLNFVSVESLRSVRSFCISQWLSDDAEDHAKLLLDYINLSEEELKPKRRGQLPILSRSAINEISVYLASILNSGLCTEHTNMALLKRLLSI